jgi:hypothetical protein
MPIIKTLQETTYRTAVPLEYYAFLTGYSECAMFGVYNPEEQVAGDACRDIWTLPQRNYILHYFQEAQEELENEARRLFSPTWVVGDYFSGAESRLVDVQNVKNTYYTKWNNVLKLGRKKVTILEEDIVVDYVTSYPMATVTLEGLDPEIVYDTNFIRVFLPGSDFEVNPSQIVYLNNKMTIWFPRCRLVLHPDNPSTGWLYTDVTNFTETLTVKYYETINEDSIVTTSSSCTCHTIDSTACLEFVTRGGNTVRANKPCIDICTCGNRDIYSGLYYLAGELNPSLQMMDMIIRLAHSKMPDEPCGCEIAQRLWRRDRNIPQILTAERLNCPFGINDGAWIAYKWSQSPQIRKLKIGHS